jgi:hypothetical protein
MTMVNTPEAEGAQALFCYIADYWGIDKTKEVFNTYYNKKNWPKEKGVFTDIRTFFTRHNKIIEKAFTSGRVDTSKTKNNIISYIERNKDWFISSLKIAQELLEKIPVISRNFKGIQVPKWQNIFYVHGDEEVMRVISKLFGSANNQSANEPDSRGVKRFGDINKWCPADIYFASQKAKKELNTLVNHEETKKNNLTFATLNELIATLVKSGDILPLSLKKVSGKISIEKVNFDRTKEEALLANTFCLGIQAYKIMTFSESYSFKNEKFKIGSYNGGRDIYIKIKSGDKEGRIQIRHIPTSKGRLSSAVKVILSYRGSSALGGQVVGIPLFTRIIESVNPNFAEKIRTQWNENYKTFVKDANRYINYGGGAENYKSNDAKIKNKFNDDIGAISGLILMNPLRKVIGDYFKKSDPKDRLAPQHNIVRALFEYVSSRTESSSRFVIVKD